MHAHNPLHSVALLALFLSLAGLRLDAAPPADDLAGQFDHPGPAYRGKPFWSWNGDLSEAELIRQIHVLKDMGMGGFFMHSRTGLATEYLGPEWFRLTNACADEARRLGMEAWLYDEDRWPSGSAGGMVTANPKFRQRFLAMRTVPGKDFRYTDDLTAAFACKLAGPYYSDCRRLGKATPPESYRDLTVLAFAVEEMEKSSFYNGYTYLDTLNREATDDFIRLTHEQYKRHCGPRLGDSIRGIFTDEPHRGSVLTGFGKSNKLPSVPWTERLPERFQAAYHYDLIDRLPELFLKPQGQDVSQVKWHYMELTQQMFLDNFAKPILDWCHANRMLATGHVLHEDSLASQTAMQGSLMRFYEYLDYPGVDVLTEGNRNYWIVKQLTSAARQLGRTRLLSELYGCTGWQMSFESHKAVGDWQALLGINLRCHHLCWYTMGGEAKRDYPASIFYQSAWWKDYDAVETYFSRLGLILAQGRPCCDLLVVNPIESVWCRIYQGWAHGLGAADPAIQQLEKQYQEMFSWLLGGHADFDYADEAMLARLYRVEKDAPGGPILWVGQASYRAVIVGGMTTIRSSTLKALGEFAAVGGRVTFAGTPPAYVDALVSQDAESLAARTTRVAWKGDEVRAACRPAIREPVEIVDRATGQAVEEVFCQLRADGPRRYLVAMNVNPQAWRKDVTIRLRGPGAVAEWNCLTGRRWAVPAAAKGAWIEFSADFPPSGEHVYVVTPERDPQLPMQPRYVEVGRQACPGPFAYTLGEKNVCVLDLARHRIAGGPWQPETEILQVDRAVRKQFGLEMRGGEMVQPWFKKKQQPQSPVKGRVRLAFAFSVEQLPPGKVDLCIEQPEAFRIAVNGHAVSAATKDWWIDPAIRRLPLPAGGLVPGKNEITLETDFRETVNLESLYLVGDFGVQLEGPRKTLVPLPEKLAVGDLVAQGLPFYSGPIAYDVRATAKAAAGQRLVVRLPKFEAACVKVASPGRPTRLVAWQPYEADVTEDVAQHGRFSLEVVLTRRNTFGPLHQVPLRARAYGPGNFVTGGHAFRRDYMLYPAGLLETPIVIMMDEKR